MSTESTGGGYLRALSYGVNTSGVPQLTSAAPVPEPSAIRRDPRGDEQRTTTGSAVVWVVYDDGTSGIDGDLRAYGAVPPSTGPERRHPSSSVVGPIGTASKFSVSTAYNGTVYVGKPQRKRFTPSASKSNAPLEAAPVDFGRVAVGSSKTQDITVTANRAMTITGVSPATGVADVAGVPARRLVQQGCRLSGIDRRLRNRGPRATEPGVLGAPAVRVVAPSWPARAS